MPLNDITYAIIGAAMKVHRSLGPGLLESAYEACLEYELKKQGFSVLRQQALPVVYDGVKIDCAYRVDLMVNGVVAVEVKAKDKFHPIDSVQLLSYLRLLKYQLGLLINFHECDLTNGIKRIANEYRDNPAPVS